MHSLNADYEYYRRSDFFKEGAMALLEGGAESCGNLVLSAAKLPSSQTYPFEAAQLALALFGGTPQQNKAAQEGFVKYILLGFSMGKEECERATAPLDAAAGRMNAALGTNDSDKMFSAMLSLLRATPAAKPFITLATGTKNLEGAARKLETTREKEQENIRSGKY